MSRETYAAMHLRRFANAVSIAMAVPGGRQRDAQTLRSLFELLGKSYESALSAKHLSALAQAKPAPSVSTAAVAAPIESVELSPATPVTAPAAVATVLPSMPSVSSKPVSEDVISQLSAISGNTAATNFFATTPWSLRKVEEKSPARPNESAAQGLQHASAVVVDTVSEESTALSYFGALAWQGGASSKVVSIQPSPAIAESEKARFGVLPSTGTPDSKAQSVDFFRGVPWSRAEQK
jgi:hypothetical protein